MILPGLLTRPVTAAPAGAALALSATRVSGPAPLGVSFAATALGFGVDRPWHDLRYRWSFADPGSFAAIDGAVFGADRNLAYGPWAVHTFAGPGTYTVTCEARSRAGRVASTTVEITVTDEDAAFPGAQTLCVSTSGTFTAAPSGADTYTDIDSAIAAVPLTGDTRILLRAGETFAPTTSIIEKSDGQIRIGAFDTGARPIINGTLSCREADSAVIHGIEVRNPYDAATGLGDKKGGLNGANLVSHFVVHDCVVGGCEDSISIGNWMQPKMAETIITDCSVTNWANFGLYLPDMYRGGVAGCSVRQKQDAVSGAGGRTDTTGADWADHGPMRFGGDVERVYVGQCELFSNNGWSGSGGAHQACIRWNTGGTDTAAGNFDRILAEGGYEILQTYANGGSSSAGAQDVIIDKCYFLASSNTRAIVGLGGGTTTLRNSILVRGDHPDDSAELGPGYRHLIAIRDSNGPVPADVLDLPINIYCNTLVDLSDEGFEDMVADLGASPYNVTEENNIRHRPNTTGVTAITTYAPLKTSPALFTPLYDGLRYASGETVPTVDTTYATPPGTPASFEPLSGSAALNAYSTGLVAIDDFAGELRADPPTSLGAWRDAGVGDTAAPTLTDATDAANGQTTSTGSVDTDEANGTLYWVVTESATAPGAAQVKAGQDDSGAAAAASGSQGVTATGTQTISSSGLTASTAYTTHFMQEDGAGTRSAVVSASGFTTEAAGPAAYRQWRILTDAGPGATEGRIGELEAYDAYGAGTDLLASLTVYTDITTPTGSASDELADIFDGTQNTGWRPGSYPADIRIDFGAGNGKTITQLRIGLMKFVGTAKNSQSGTVQYWDGAQYVTAWSYAFSAASDSETWEVRDDGTAQAV